METRNKEEQQLEDVQQKRDFIAPDRRGRIIDIGAAVITIIAFISIIVTCVILTTDGPHPHSILETVVTIIACLFLALISALGRIKSVTLYYYHTKG